MEEESISSAELVAGSGPACTGTPKSMDPQWVELTPGKEGLQKLFPIMDMCLSEIVSS